MGDNAEMLQYERAALHNCAYPRRLALERFKVHETYQNGTLVQFRDAPTLRHSPIGSGPTMVGS